MMCEGLKYLESGAYTSKSGALPAGSSSVHIVVTTTRFPQFLKPRGRCFEHLTDFG